MTPTINDYLVLTVADLLRMGFLKPNEFVRGTIRFYVGGKERAAVGAATDTRGVPVLKLAYTLNGKPIDTVIYLRWKNSNLTPDTEHGYYYFVCPVSGRLCRKLYIVDGKFMGRQAFKPLYERQTQSRRRRSGLFRVIEDAQVIEELMAQKYRRERYRDKLTPYGRKLQRLNESIQRHGEMLDR